MQQLTEWECIAGFPKRMMISESIFGSMIEKTKTETEMWLHALSLQQMLLMWKLA